MKPKHPEVPTTTMMKLRQICRALPEVQEEQASVGVRWRIRKKTFAHALVVQAGWPPAYAQAVETDDPVPILTFHTGVADADPLPVAGHHYFRPALFPNIVGLILDAHVDWAEVNRLLTTSYCVQAPKKLRANLEARR